MRALRDLALHVAYKTRYMNVITVACLLRNILYILIHWLPLNPVDFSEWPFSPQVKPQLHSVRHYGYLWDSFSSVCVQSNEFSRELPQPQWKSVGLCSLCCPALHFGALQHCQTQSALGIHTRRGAQELSAFVQQSHTTQVSWLNRRKLIMHHNRLKIYEYVFFWIKNVSLNNLYMFQCWQAAVAEAASLLQFLWCPAGGSSCSARCSSQHAGLLLHQRSGFNIHTKKISSTFETNQ